MRPDRYLSQSDASILCKVAQNLLHPGAVDFNAGERLVDIIATSIILPEHVRIRECVPLFSEVTYSNLSAGTTQSVVLVCPQDANQALAIVSVVSSIGLALIGRMTGAIVNIDPPHGATRHIKILDVKSLVTVNTRRPRLQQALVPRPSHDDCTQSTNTNPMGVNDE